MANIVNSFFHRHPERLKKTQGFRKGIWGFFWRPSISVPAVVDRQWLDQQLGGLAALAREHGEEEVIGFLERLLTTTGVRKDSVLQAHVLYALQARLAAAIPADAVRLQECLQRMEALLAQYDGATDVIWLKLRGAVTRLKRAFQNKTEEEARSAGALFHANELLAGSLRNLNDPLALSAAGEAYLNASLHEVAQRCLERAEQQGVQDSGRTAFLAGQCSFHLGQYERAAQAFDRALNQNWPQAEITDWQAGALYEIGRYDEAEQWAYAGLPQAAGKTAATLQTLLGKIKLEREDFAAARDWFIKAHASDANAAEAQYGLGLCALYEDIDTARSCFTALLSHPEGGPLGSLGLGMLAAGQDDILPAIQHLTEAVRHFPAHGGAHLRLGECLFEAGEYAKAQHHFTQAQKLGFIPSNLLLRRGFAALALGDLEAACELLGDYRETGSGELDVTPYLVDALTQMINAALARYDLVQALHGAEECYRLTPEDPGVAESLGLLLYNTAREQVIVTGRASDQTVKMFAQAWELCRTDITFAGTLAARVFSEDAASLDELLATLEAGQSDSSFVALVRLFAAYRRQDVDAIQNVGAIDCDDPLPGQLQRLIPLHIKIVQTGKRTKLTAEETKELLGIFDTPEFKRAFAAQREAVNRLLVSLLLQGGHRPDRIRKAIEDLARTDRDGFWNEARAFAQFLTASRSNELYAECQNVIDLCRKMDLVDRPFIKGLLLRAERAKVAKLLEISNFAHAFELLKAQVREGHGDELSERIAKAIGKFLSTDSLEGAHLAKSIGDAPQARKIWETLARQGNTEAAHQLAVFLFSQGYEEVIRQDKQAVQTLSTALPYWKIVYEADTYWRKQQDKCQALHTNKYPFRPETLEQIRQELPLDALTVLTELAIRYARSGDVPGATQCVQAVLKSPFEHELGRRALEERFAPPLLDEGALSSNQDPKRFDRALKSAELVLDCDPANCNGLSLALDAAYSQGEDAQKRITIKFARDALPLFSRARRRLQKFSEPQLKSDALLTSRCKSFWREFGAMLELAIGQAHAEFLNCQEYEQIRILREVRQYVDCALSYVLPNCDRWSVGDQQWSFKQLDKELSNISAPSLDW